MTETLDGDWFYTSGADNRGPFSASQMKALIETGTVAGQTLVWTKGLADWIDLRSSSLAQFIVLPDIPPPINRLAPVYNATEHGASHSMSPVDAVKSGFTNYFNFSGRAARSEFWYYNLAIFLASLGFLLLDFMIFGTNSEYQPLNTLFSLLVFIPGLAMMSRRLHDTNRSAWWFAIVLVPIVGIIALIVFWCQKGTEGANRFG